MKNIVEKIDGILGEEVDMYPQKKKDDDEKESVKFADTLVQGGWSIRTKKVPGGIKVTAVHIKDKKKIEATGLSRTSALKSVKAKMK